MIFKHAQIQMSYEVTEKEITDANKLISYFDKFNKKLDVNKNHLDEILNSFKDAPENTDPEEVYNKRGIFIAYKDEVKQDFLELIQLAVYCLATSNLFNTDSQIQQLVSSFNDYVEDLQKQVGFFEDVFNDLKDKDFGKNVVEVVKDVKKTSVQLEQLIKERIIPHMKKNIMGQNWATEISEKSNVSLERPKPFMVQLEEKRKEDLKNVKNNQVKNNQVNKNQ